MGTDFLAGIPVIVALLAIILACRWVFSGNGVRKVVARPDYGLLSPAARADDALGAEHMRLVLADQGIRGTVAPAGKGFDANGIPWPTGSHVVLVFPTDVERAVELLAASPR